MAQAARAARDRQAATAPPGRTDAHAAPERRTVTITGHPGHRPPVRHLRVVDPADRGAPLTARVVQVQRRRPARRPGEHLHAQPDRLAMWALLMALFLILVVAVSS